MGHSEEVFRLDESVRSEHNLLHFPIERDEPFQNQSIRCYVSFMSLLFLFVIYLFIFVRIESYSLELPVL